MPSSSQSSDQGTDFSIANRQSPIENRPVPIGIAVVEREGCYLVGVRGPGGPLPGYSEFPGGKCEPGESPADCACRECLEETGLEVVAEELLLRRTFAYAHAVVDLHFWRCRPADAARVRREHCGYRWAAASELRSLRFPEANAPLIERLASQGERGASVP